MELGQREFSLRGGRIILHTRADDRHGVWQCRLRLGTERKPDEDGGFEVGDKAKLFES